MSALTDVVDELREIELALRDNPNLARRLHAVVTLLGSDATLWVSVVEATSVLEIYPEHVVVGWARTGLLRSRYLPDDSLQVSLDDVLQQKSLYAALAADWPDRVPTADELGVSGVIDPEAMTADEQAIVTRARERQRTRAEG